MQAINSLQQVFIFLRTCLILIAFSLSCHSADADNNNPFPAKNEEGKMYFRHLTRNDGLPSNRTYGALQDFRGYMWIATDNGLARYDGKNFRIFSHIPGDDCSIIDNTILSIHESRDSMLWIGTVDGISIYNPLTGGFRNFSINGLGKDRFPGKGIISFFQEKDGSMWVGTENGLVHTTAQGGNFEEFPTQSSNVAGTREYAFKHICVIIEDPRDKNKLLLATLGGILQFDKKNHKITRDYKKIINNNFGIIDMYLEDNHCLWTCGWGIGLNCLDLNTGQWKEYPFNSKKPYDIVDITKKSKDEFWLGTMDHGLGRFNIRTGSSDFYEQDPLSDYSLISQSIKKIVYLNNGKDIWLLSDDGINILNRDYLPFTEVALPFQGNWATCFYRDKEEKRFYVGASDSKGLFFWDEEKSRWNLIPAEEEYGSKGMGISRMLKDSQSRLWLAMRNNLHYYDPKTGRIRLFRTKEGIPIKLEDPVIRCMFEDDRGNLWVGTRSGEVVRIDPGRSAAEYFTHQPGNPNSLLNGTRIRMFYQDKFNRIWIGLDNGVSIYDPDKNCFLNSIMDSILSYGVTKRWINSINQDTLGRIWLNIDCAGMLRVEQFQKDRFRFKLFNTNNGLNGLSLGNMAIDPGGDFWIINYGLLHMNPFDETFQLYDQRNGLNEDLGFEESIYIDHEGNIFIGNEGKFVTRNLRDLHYTSPVIKLVMESIDVNGKEQPIVFKSDPEKKLILKGDENNLVFHYTAICFKDADQLLFRYRLIGFDQDWIFAGPSRDVRYGNLPPGKYQFAFSVSNRGVWTDYQQRMIIVIRPLFYKTWWFITLLVCILFFLGYLLIRYRFRQVLKLERLRTRIATDLHDEVGSTLSSISILSEILGTKLGNTPFEKIIAEIHGSSTKMLEGIDDIIWLVNPKNDVFRNLELRIREYAIPLFESRDIDFKIRYDEKLSAIQLPMEVRRNIYLVSKEAINNLVKYSRCSKAEIKFTAYSEGIEMSVTDNGVGFDPRCQTTRNGLKNMKMRAGQIKGSLNVNSAPGKGTQIILKIKTIY